MAIPKQKNAGRYTYADYLQWPNELRCEVINGEFYDLSPTPSTSHQSVSLHIAVQLSNQLQGKRCQLFTAPVDVVLPAPGESANDSSTVVQPDILVVCDAKKITERAIIGAPDFVIEIASPSTAKKDSVTKRALYEAQGVAEYWQVLVKDQLVWIYRRGKNGRYGEPDVQAASGVTKLAALPGASRWIGARCLPRQWAETAWRQRHGLAPLPNPTRQRGRGKFRLS